MVLRLGRALVDTQRARGNLPLLHAALGNFESLNIGVMSAKGVPADVVSARCTRQYGAPSGDLRAGEVN